MSGILKSWIRGKLRDSLASILENPMHLGQHHRVQVVRFLTYKNPVFAEVSDMETVIFCEFTKDCVEAYQNEFGKRFTQIRGAYLTLKNMSLEVYEESNFKILAKLIVRQIQFLGGDGEAIVGHPVFFDEYPEIRTLLYSIHIKKLIWPQSLIKEQEEVDKPPEIKLLNESVETFTKKNKKRIFFSTPLSNNQGDLSKKKQKRFLHPGWRGFFEVTYQDCIISDDQRKILERDEAWYPPISMPHEIVIPENTAHNESKDDFGDILPLNGPMIDKLSSPSGSPFSWEESPTLNQSSTSISEIKEMQNESSFFIDKERFFSDNDTLPPSSPSITSYSPLLQTSM
ncbi:hypothetical protein PNEG_03089 [Pneumocystis murina B123]|uniref:Shelterin complex subunit TPP1/Est3 domain-containing protein n=1 Tax=Pneumocystis murina (strain B123) TaxID=1069680 RepID=M7NJ23_PNEMU|nr:hypothetical protein PNEG_03089 [Pneumocystis murina B123]EMR08613.1 hypothetical protein PNEG_03089 [Pneumocystis murina B123]